MTLCFALGFTLFCTPLFSVFAQTKKPATKRLTGSVLEVEKKGKSILLKWQEGQLRQKPEAEKNAESQKTPTSPSGSPIELLISSKSRIQITAPGKPEMLAIGAVVGVQLEGDDNVGYKAHRFNVFLGTSPGPSVVKDENEPHRYNAIGRIEALQDNLLQINFGSHGTKTVTIYATPEVRAIASSPAFLKPGVEGTVEYLPSREVPKPATLIALEAERTEPFDPAEMLGGNLAQGKPTPTKSTPVAKKKPPVLKQAPTAGKSVKDPFGVLDK